MAITKQEDLTCQGVTDILERLDGNQLQPSEEESITRHGGSCSSCQEIYRAYKRDEVLANVVAQALDQGCANADERKLLDFLQSRLKGKRPGLRLTSFLESLKDPGANVEVMKVSGGKGFVAHCKPLVCLFHIIDTPALAGRMVQALELGRQRGLSGDLRVVLAGCPGFCPGSLSAHVAFVGMARTSREGDICDFCDSCILFCLGQALSRGGEGGSILRDLSHCLACGDCNYACRRSSWAVDRTGLALLVSSGRGGYLKVADFVSPEDALGVVERIQETLSPSGQSWEGLTTRMGLDLLIKTAIEPVLGSLQDPSPFDIKRTIEAPEV